MIDPDAIFFREHPDRQAHIRMPMAAVLHKDKQRQVRYAPECEAEFQTLGDHDKSRRRIILWKIPLGNPYLKKTGPAILKVPFLAYFDETIADTDAVLLPILAEIMEDARKQYVMER